MFKAFFREFREFAVRGSVVDMAVGIIIGGAFGKIVTSFVSDVMMPPLGFILGRLDFKDKVLRLGTDAVGKSVELKYGLFISAAIDFLLVALAVFLLVKGINRLRRQPPPPSPDTKECPFCRSSIPTLAVKCAHCTSELKSA